MKRIFLVLVLFSFSTIAYCSVEKLCELDNEPHACCGEKPCPSQNDDRLDTISFTFEPGEKTTVEYVVVTAHQAVQKILVRPLISSTVRLRI